MLVTIQGQYQDGRLELEENPPIHASRVMVTFLDSAEVDQSQQAALRQRAFERMRTGISLGGPPYPTDDEIYGHFR
jgi:hypothetical protein